MARTASTTPTRPVTRREAPSLVEVTAVTRLTPHLVRVTLTGPALHQLVDAGPDQRFKLLLPRAGQDRPALPGGPDWFTAWRAQPADLRPIMRTYTIRHLRPTAAEIDVDFALHEPADHPNTNTSTDTDDGHGDGPATAWARRARVGDRVGMSGTRSEYAPPPAGRALLIAGDDTALPAIANILERLPTSTTATDTGAVAQVFLEVGEVADRLELVAPAGVTVTWVYRRGGGTLLDAVRRAELPTPPPHAWLAGERDAVRAVRAHLVDDRGLDPATVTFSGYWRRDGPIDPS